MAGSRGKYPKPLLILSYAGMMELGRRSGLKIRWAKARAGSSPATRTICLGRIMVSTEPCQGSNTGSIPVQDSYWVAIQSTQFKK